MSPERRPVPPWQATGRRFRCVPLPSPVATVRVAAGMLCAVDRLTQGDMALRLARGLFRLWLVLSVLWIGAVGVVTWQTLPEPELPSICDLPANERSADFDCSWFAGVKRYWSMILDPKAPSWAVGPEREAIRFATLLALLPPIFVFALGWALGWALRGWRPASARASLSSLPDDAHAWRLGVGHITREGGGLFPCAARSCTPKFGRWGMVACQDASR
jgi:hypothetical protein